MERLLSIAAGLSLLLIGIVLFAIRRAHIRVEYSVSWLTAASALFVLSTWKEGLSYIGEILGLDNAPYVLLLIIGILFLFVFFRFSVIISNLKDANIALTQKVAILEYQLHSIHEESETKA
jgi:hypothetical protein